MRSASLPEPGDVPGRGATAVEPKIPKLATGGDSNLCLAESAAESIEVVPTSRSSGKDVVLVETRILDREPVGIYKHLGAEGLDGRSELVTSD
jgi:hypothetical protein